MIQQCSLLKSAGRISEGEVIAQVFVLLGAGIGTAFLLDKWAGHEFPTLTVRQWLDNRLILF